MVSWSVDEVQFLVTLVREREALYDVANEDYTNRDIVWALWTDIARQLNKTRTYCSFGLKKYIGRRETCEILHTFAL